MKVESKITVNGKEYALPCGTTLAEFMNDNGIDSAKTVAAVNGVVVKRDAIDTCVLNDGDAVDLMTFVGGG